MKVTPQFAVAALFVGVAVFFGFKKVSNKPEVDIPRVYSMQCIFPGSEPSAVMTFQKYSREGGVIVMEGGTSKIFYFLKPGEICLVQEGVIPVEPARIPQNSSFPKSSVIKNDL